MEKVSADELKLKRQNKIRQRVSILKSRHDYEALGNIFVQGMTGLRPKKLNPNTEEPDSTSTKTSLEQDNLQAETNEVAVVDSEELKSVAESENSQEKISIAPLLVKTSSDEHKHPTETTHDDRLREEGLIKEDSVVEEPKLSGKLQNPSDEQITMTTPLIHTHPKCAGDGNINSNLTSCYAATDKYASSPELGRHGARKNKVSKTASNNKDLSEISSLDPMARSINLIEKEIVLQTTRAHDNAAEPAVLCCDTTDGKQFGVVCGESFSVNHTGDKDDMVSADEQPAMNCSIDCSSAEGGLTMDAFWETDDAILPTSEQPATNKRAMRYVNPETGEEEIEYEDFKSWKREAKTSQKLNASPVTTQVLRQGSVVHSTVPKMVEPQTLDVCGSLAPDNDIDNWLKTYPVNIINLAAVPPFSDEEEDISDSELACSENESKTYENHEINLLFNFVFSILLPQYIRI